MSNYKQSANSLVSKIIFTIGLLIVCRIGSFIPVAGVDSLALSSLAEKNQSGVLGMFNMLSGGALGRMSIFALAIMPYITASIIMQLLAVVYKPLEQLKKEGESGRRKMSQLSRYLTVVLAAFQAYGVAVGLEAQVTDYGPIVVIPSFLFRFTTIITLVVGTILLMWMGEQITTKGIGNGSSLIIFIGIVSGLPSSIINILDFTRKGVISPMVLLIVTLFVLGIIALVVFFERAQRKVLVHYPKRQMGNKIYGGDSTHMPLKLNTAGVIPPIFTSSLLLFPITISNFATNNDGILGTISYYLAHGKPLYIVFSIILIVFFSFFYTSVVFNSEETANNLRKYGAYIPGKRPGKNTAEYFDYLLVRLTVIGAIYLSFVCVIPEIIMNKYAVSFALSGTSFLIIVNVVLETFSQVQTHLFSSKYEGLVKKFRVK